MGCKNSTSELKMGGAETTTLNINDEWSKKSLPTLDNMIAGSNVNDISVMSNDIRRFST